jgi:SAM-dependent methyltransferase
MMICEVCIEPVGGLSLDLGSHPLCDDLVPIGSVQVAPKYHQLITLCENCLTAHQTIQVEKELLFKPSYHYRASLTKDVLDGMRSLVHSIESAVGALPSDATVLDIGCNDGSLLGIFKETFGCATIGVDPTEAILESGAKIDFKFNEYFSEETVSAIKSIASCVDLITFTNVFAHIENLPNLLNNLRDLISDDTALIIENHYLGAILDRNQFDTFYHEHPRTYSLRSFQYVARSMGMNITHVEFPSRYGGNIRVIMKKGGEALDLSSYIKLEDKFTQNFESLQNTYDAWKFHAKLKISELSARGLIYGKALPGRAVMLISALEVDSDQMPVIFEQPKSPKIGNLAPGSKIEVHSDEDLLEANPAFLIVWSWHIIDEIVQYLDSLGYKGEIWVPMPEFRLYRPAL